MNLGVSIRKSKRVELIAEMLLEFSAGGGGRSGR